MGMNIIVLMNMLYSFVIVRMNFYKCSFFIIGFNVIVICCYLKKI